MIDNIPELIFLTCETTNAINAELDLSNKTNDEKTTLIYTKILKFNRASNKFIIFKLYDNLYEVIPIRELMQRHLQITIPIKNNTTLTILHEYAIMSIRRAKRIIQHEIDKYKDEDALLEHNMILLDKLSIYEGYFRQKLFSFLEKTQLIEKPSDFENRTFKWRGDVSKIESLYNYLIIEKYVKSNRTELEIFQQLFDNNEIQRFSSNKIIWEDRAKNGSARIYSIRILIETLLDQNLIDSIHYNPKDFMRVIKSSFLNANKEPIGELKKSTSVDADEIRKKINFFIQNL